MKLSHAVWGYARQPGRSGEVWQNVVHWRREWQTTSVFLPWEHEQYEKADLRVCYKTAPWFFILGGHQRKGPISGFSRSALWTFRARWGFVMELSVWCSFCRLDACSTLPGQLWQPKLSPDFAKCLLGRRDRQDHRQLNWEALLWTIIWAVSLLAKHSTDAANEARTVFSRLPWAAHIRRQCVLRALRHWAKSFPQNSRQGKGEAASVLQALGAELSTLLSPNIDSALREH